MISLTHHLKDTMHDSSLLMLGLYAGIAFLVSLAGGSLPSLVRLTHTRLQTALGFIAGLMLGMALLHLIPHAAEGTHSVERAGAWALGGFLVMFFLQRVFHHHQHGVPGDPASGPTPADCCGQAHSANTTSDIPRVPARRVSWIAVALGMTFHSIIDGLALAAAVMAESHALVGLVGLGTALAVVLHKPFDALSVLTLMKAGGCGSRSRWVMNVGVALVTPLGAALGFMGLGSVAEANQEVLGCALGFCAGGFLCIASSDLLPELHFHSHDRLRLSLALLAGVAVTVLAGAFHGHDHDHGHDQGPAHSQGHSHDHGDGHSHDHGEDHQHSHSDTHSTTP